MHQVEENYNTKFKREMKTVLVTVEIVAKQMKKWNVENVTKTVLS